MTLSEDKAWRDGYALGKAAGLKEATLIDAHAVEHERWRITESILRLNSPDMQQIMDIIADSSNRAKTRTPMDEDNKNVQGPLPEEVPSEPMPEEASEA